MRVEKRVLNAMLVLMMRQASDYHHCAMSNPEPPTLTNRYRELLQEADF